MVNGGIEPPTCRLWIRRLTNWAIYQKKKRLLAASNPGPAGSEAVVLPTGLNKLANMQLFSTFVHNLKNCNYPIDYLSTTSLQAKFAFGPYLLWGHLIEIVQNSISQSIFGVTNWDFVTRNVIVMPWMCKKHRSQILKFQNLLIGVEYEQIYLKIRNLKRQCEPVSLLLA